MPDRTSRRDFLRRLLGVAAATAAAPLVAACARRGPSPQGADELPTPGRTVMARWPRLTSDEVIVAGFGGETYEIRHELIFDPFTELTGVRVVDAPWDYGKFLAMLESPQAEWDMIDFDGFSLVGLVQAGTPPAKLAGWVRRCDLVDPPWRDYAGGGYAYSVVLGWSTELEQTPTNWADFFDVERFPGKRAFPKTIYAGTVEIALLADGVPKDEIYPLDFDRAFAKLDTIKEHLLFYDSYSQGQQYIVQGSASMIATANSRALQLVDDGVPFRFTYQDQILYPWSAFAMPQNPPHPDAANALIDYMSTPEVQAIVARELALGPVVSAAFDLLDDATIERIPNSETNRAKALVVDTETAAKQDAEYVNRFYTWVGA